MRNSANEYKLGTTSGLLAVLLTTLLWPFVLSGDQDFRISSEDMIAIRADQAWEDIEPDTAHFSGHFEMRVRDLQLTADRATIYGQFDNPDRLVLEGSPARINLSHTAGDRTEAIRAEAQEIVYEREPGLMRFIGAARLAQGDNVLLSDSIEYEIKTNRFHGSGKTGVQITIPAQQ